MPDYKKLDDLKGYVRTLLDSHAPVITAEKAARITAVPGVPGTRVISWSVDVDGASLVEKNAVVCADAFGVPDWVATKADPLGNPVIDRNGHANQWIICDAVFRKKYQAVPGQPGLYQPAGGPQRFVRLPEAVRIIQWGEEWNVDAGGYINITDPEDLYVISGRDFADTYRVL